MRATQVAVNSAEKERTRRMSLGPMRSMLETEHFDAVTAAHMDDHVSAHVPPKRALHSDLNAAVSKKGDALRRQATEAFPDEAPEEEDRGAASTAEMEFLIKTVLDMRKDMRAMAKEIKLLRQAVASKA